MAEEEKKGRGRPKKKAPEVENEQQDKITMSQSNEEQSKYKAYIEQKQGVGQVRDKNAIGGNITLEDVTKRWRSLFAKYSDAGFDALTRAWGNNVDFLNNPYLQNNRIKQINSTPQKYDKTLISDALANPENSESLLRSSSWALYYNNFIYQTLIQLNRHTPKYNYYATPLYVDSKDKQGIKKDSQRVDKILKKFNPKLTLKTIASQVYTEGKCAYLVRTSYDKKDIDFLVLQKLNSDMVKLTGFGSKQQFVASFNMMIFLEPAYDVSQYPKFIQDTWEDMIGNGIITQDKKGKKVLNPKSQLPLGHMIESKNGRYMYWVRLPQDLCWVFYSDGSHPNAFPDTLGLFPDLTSLDDYRWLQGNLLSRGVTSILTAEVPLV